MYVANSEPARWVCGGGRADSTERGPISDHHRSALEPDGIRGGDVSYPGKPYCPAVQTRSRKPNRERRPRNGEGAEGGRSTDSTDDSGPMKPGNSVEDKTLMTEAQRGEETTPDREPAACDGQHTSGPGGSPNHWEDSGATESPPVCGKPWTRGEVDHVGEPTQRMVKEARKPHRGMTSQGTGTKSATWRSSVIPASARSQPFPVISCGRRSRRK